MDKRGQMFVNKGFAFGIFAFFMMLTAFALIDPYKENLDISRGDPNLNCPGTPAFNQVDYDNDTEFERLVRRPTCFVTGIGFFYFYFSLIVSIVVWTFTSFGKK